MTRESSSRLTMTCTSGGSFGGLHRCNTLVICGRPSGSDISRISERSWDDRYPIEAEPHSGCSLGEIATLLMSNSSQVASWHRAFRLFELGRPSQRSLCLWGSLGRWLLILNRRIILICLHGCRLHDWNHLRAFVHLNYYGQCMPLQTCCSNCAQDLIITFLKRDCFIISLRDSLRVASSAKRPAQRDNLT